MRTLTIGKRSPFSGQPGSLVASCSAAWDDLTDRAHRACVVFADCGLPPGCIPATARVGFEIHGTEAVLFVDRGIHYGGRSNDLRAWLDAGQKRFPGVASLRNWITEEIAPLFEAAPDARHLVPASPPEPGTMTDLDAVSATAASHQAARIDDGDLRELRGKVYGQHAALTVLSRRVSQHVRRAHPRRSATMLALGPTGVGKTRTAQALAESLGSLLAGRWSALIRLNMNEYQERHRVSQLFGAPPSYIGYGDGTPLIDRLAVQPESIVLFDEIEKAGSRPRVGS